MTRDEIIARAKAKGMDDATAARAADAYLARDGGAAKSGGAPDKKPEPVAERKAAKSGPVPKKDEPAKVADSPPTLSAPSRPREQVTPLGKAVVDVLKHDPVGPAVHAGLEGVRSRNQAQIDALNGPRLQSTPPGPPSARAHVTTAHADMPAPTVPKGVAGSFGRADLKRADEEAVRAMGAQEKPDAPTKPDARAKLKAKGYSDEEIAAATPEQVERAAAAL